MPKSHLDDFKEDSIKNLNSQTGFEIPKNYIIYSKSVDEKVLLTLIKRGDRVIDLFYLALSRSDLSSNLMKNLVDVALNDMGCIKFGFDGLNFYLEILKRRN